MKADTSKTDAKNGHARLAVRKGAAPKVKAAKDPNKPKRPPSAYFVFMEDFRDEYKQAHPNNKSVATVCKAGGAKWSSLSDSEKVPYIEKAEKRKAEYAKNMNAYHKKLAGGPQDEPPDDSDKSKSEVNDEDDGNDSGEQGEN